MGFSKSFGEALGNGKNFNTEKQVGENVYIKVPKTLADMETKNSVRFKFILKNNCDMLMVFPNEIYKNLCYNDDIVSIKININNPDKKYKVFRIKKGGSEYLDVPGETIISSYETRFQKVIDAIKLAIEIQQKLDAGNELEEEEKKHLHFINNSFEGFKGEMLADAYIRAWNDYTNYVDYKNKKKEEENKNQNPQNENLNQEPLIQETEEIADV